jgi:hypothetical protein
MLRHIVSLSLAMTACATLMPTKANAATLTVIPVGEIQKNPGESIEFIFAFDPTPSFGYIVRFITLDFRFDGSELSERVDERFTLPINTAINDTTTVARRRFDVIRPIKDGSADLFNATVTYNLGGAVRDSVTLPVSGGDVVPVPEPLTIFGTATAFGCGVLFKRKSSKKTVS